MTASIEDSVNFRRIDDRLTTSGVVGTDRLDALSSQGYAAVINLLPDSSEHAIANERGIVESQRLEYIHIPVDFTHPTRSDFKRFSDAMERLSGKKVHVHCAANYRVSAFYSLYAARHGLWSEDQAMAFINSVWQPIDYPAWPEFIAEILGDVPGSQ